jgi:hypothetical protein
MGGGGGDSGSSAMMMAVLMQQMQQQAEAQRRQFEQQQASMNKQYADNSRNRYNTLLKQQNTKIGDLYTTYNKNIDDTLAIDPTFDAGKKLDFTQFDYETPQGFDGMDANSVDKLYGELDSKSFDDYNNFKKQVDQSNVWLNAANQKKDILGRNMPGVAVAPWGGGGGMVSGGAGADSLKPGAGTGLIGDADPNAKPALGDVFSNAVAGATDKTASAGKSIF